MIFLIKAIRAAVIMLSFGAWAVFMLVTSDVPPNITSNEARLLFALFLLIGATTPAEAYMSIKNGERSQDKVLLGRREHQKRGHGKRRECDELFRRKRSFWEKVGLGNKCVI